MLSHIRKFESYILDWLNKFFFNNQYFMVNRRVRRLSKFTENFLSD